MTKIVLFTESNAEQNCVDTGRRDVQKIEKTMLNQDVHTENCCLRKKQSFKRKKAESLADSTDDPKQFWKEVKACIRFGRKQNVENKITKDQWLEHFMTVFNSGNNDRESDVEKWGKEQ